MVQFDELKHYLHNPPKISSPVSKEAISPDDSAKELTEPELNIGEATNVDSDDLLQADGYHEELEVMEVDPAIVAANCGKYNYYYTIIGKDEFVIPPT